MKMNAHFNRQGRKSGGYRSLKIITGHSTGKDFISIQCYEQRHLECLGNLEPFAPVDCDCNCHKKP